MKDLDYPLGIIVLSAIGNINSTVGLPIKGLDNKVQIDALIK
jgi:hypothetical protein